MIHPLPDSKRGGGVQFLEVHMARVANALGTALNDFKALAHSVDSLF